MLPRKHRSGNQKRKERKQEAENIKSQVGSLNKYFVKKTNVSVENNVEELVNESEQQVEEFLENENVLNRELGEDENDIDLTIDENANEFNHEPTVLEPIFDLNIYDPRVWDNLDAQMRDLLVENGPVTETDMIFPHDEVGRQFSCEHYVRKLPNGEPCHRKWLIYSKELDKVFLFLL